MLVRSGGRDSGVPFRIFHTFSLTLIGWGCFIHFRAKIMASHDGEAMGRKCAL